MNEYLKRLNVSPGVRPRCVYFLGAGASKAVCPMLPLASELTCEHLLDLKSYKLPPSEAVYQLRTYLEQTGQLERALPLGFEDFLPHLATNRGPFWPYENALFCLLRRPLFDGTESFGLGLWLNAARHLGDAIVTTNYDTVVEWELGLSGEGIIGAGGADLLDLGIPTDWLAPGVRALFSQVGGTACDKLLLLKLYGSVSWNACVKCDLCSLHPIYDHGAEDAITMRNPCTVCNQRDSLRIVAVPLVRGKGPENQHKVISEIWRRARVALASCTDANDMRRFTAIWFSH